MSKLIERANPEDAQLFEVGMDSRDYPPDVWEEMCRELGLPVFDMSAPASAGGGCLVTDIDQERGVMTMSCSAGELYNQRLQPVRWVSREELLALYPGKRVLCGREWPLQRCERAEPRPASEDVRQVDADEDQWQGER